MDTIIEVNNLIEKSILLYPDDEKKQDEYLAKKGLTWKNAIWVNCERWCKTAIWTALKAGDICDYCHKARTIKYVGG